jgi:putative tryptophan/tyrosine transport system substrate-binding protein
MRRREFITLVGGGAVWPFAARSQQSELPVIGVISGGAAAENSSRLTELLHGFTDAALVEGRNVAVVYRWADNQYDQVPALAADLARAQVNIIVALDGISARAAKAATTTIPIVFDSAVDPIKAGLVAGLAHPGSNLTGTANLGGDLEQKKLEILHDILPFSSNIGVLLNPTNPNLYQSTLKDTQAAALVLGRQLHFVHASTEPELEMAFAELDRQRSSGVTIGLDLFFTAHTTKLATLSLQHRMPSIYQYREFAMAGGLMSFGASLTEAYRKIGIFIARILKGEKPADLPVQETTKVEFFINLKTAKALGVAMPLTLLGRADTVIE